MLEATKAYDNKQVRISFSGELGKGDAAALESLIERLFTAGENDIVLALEKCPKISAECESVLVRAKEHARQSQGKSRTLR